MVLRVDVARSPARGEIVTQTPRSVREAGIESELLDLGGVSLTRLRTMEGRELRRSLRHAVERVSHIQVTASGSGGGNDAKRID